LKLGCADRTGLDLIGTEKERKKERKKENPDETGKRKANARLHAPESINALTVICFVSILR
jgi:hypothetical protein